MAMVVPVVASSVCDLLLQACSCPTLLMIQSYRVYGLMVQFASSWSLNAVVTGMRCAVHMHNTVVAALLTCTATVTAPKTLVLQWFVLHRCRRALHSCQQNIAGCYHGC